MVPPRLCLIGFNFCQPFLINRAVTFSQQAVTPQTTNIGYGLIGAYVLVFVGIAVRIRVQSNALICLDLVLTMLAGVYGPISAQDV